MQHAALGERDVRRVEHGVLLGKERRGEEEEVFFFFFSGSAVSKRSMAEEKNSLFHVASSLHSRR